jgi:hypothetical protein
LVVIIIAVQARQPGLDHRNLLSKERIDLWKVSSSPHMYTVEMNMHTHTHTHTHTKLQKYVWELTWKILFKTAKIFSEASINWIKANVMSNLDDSFTN